MIPITVALCIVPVAFAISSLARGLHRIARAVERLALANEQAAIEAQVATAALSELAAVVEKASMEPVIFASRPGQRLN